MLNGYGWEFFSGFSGVLLPYTILYTRARDGAASRPTDFFAARRMAFKLQIRKLSGFVYIIPWFRIFALYHATPPSHGTGFFCCTTG
jgi:hypothetical protein